MPRGHSANNERSARPRVGLTSSDTTRQHHVSNSPFSMPTRGRSAGNRSLIFLEMPLPLMCGVVRIRRARETCTEKYSLFNVTPGVSAVIAPQIRMRDVRAVGG